MSAEMAEAIRQLVQEKGIDEDLVLKMIEDVITSYSIHYTKLYEKHENEGKGDPEGVYD